MSQHCQETLSLFSGVGSFDKYPCNNIEALNVVPVYWVAVITSVKCKQWPQSPPPNIIISFIIRSQPWKCDVHCSHTLLYIHTTLSQKSFSFGKRLLSLYYMLAFLDFIFRWWRLLFPNCCMQRREDTFLPENRVGGRGARLLKIPSRYISKYEQPHWHWMWWTQVQNTENKLTLEKYFC